MKKLIATTLLCTLVGLAAYAQGTVSFKNINSSPAINAPVHLSDGTTLLGSTFEAALWAGPSAGNMYQVATAAFSGGYFLGGAQTITSVAGGAVAFIQIDAWDTTLGGTTTGATDAQAKAYWQAGHANVWGASFYNYNTLVATPFSVTTGNPSGVPPTTPAFLAGLTSFNLAPVIPEPSTFALAGLGAAALMIFRRRK